MDCWKGFRWRKERKAEWDEPDKKRGVFMDMINRTTSDENVFRRNRKFFTGKTRL